MAGITRDALIELLAAEQTRRKQFSAHSGIQRNKSRPTFSVPFDCGMVQHFQEGTQLRLTYNPLYDQHYCFLSAQQIDEVKRWEKRQGTRVFLRTLLSLAVALDLNFEDNVSGRKTHLGQLEELAKHHADEVAIQELVSRAAETVRDIVAFRDAPYLCAIPAMASKSFDLPTELAGRLAKHMDKKNLTPHFRLENKARSLKECSLEEKWQVWEKADFSYNGPSLDGASVVVIDDKYQAGVTIHYFSSLLEKLRAKSIYGLCMVKTLRDTDNL